MYIRAAELRPKLGSRLPNAEEWTVADMLELAKCETDNDAKRVAKKVVEIFPPPIGQGKAREQAGAVGCGVGTSNTKDCITSKPDLRLKISREVIGVSPCGKFATG